MLQYLLNTILTLLFPQECKLCGESVEEAALGVCCARCWSDQKHSLKGGCPKCSFPHPKSNSSTTCKHCADDHYDSVSYVGAYDGPVRQQILELKRTRNIPPLLVELIKREFRNSPFLNADLIVPVPLSKKRMLRRGYNQAVEIAKIIETDIGIDLDETALVRRKHSDTDRTGMDNKGRRMSVERAFVSEPDNNIEGKKIVLVDDVFTTGATVSECARELKRKGALRVDVFAIARRT